MSQTTREINRITTTIISVSCKLLIYALVFFLMYEGITKGYSYGHEIFAPTPMSKAPGIEKEIIIKEEADVSDVAGLLKKKGLIRDELILKIQAKIYEYEIYPGSYTFNTSMTSKEILKQIDEQAINSEDKTK